MNIRGLTRLISDDACAVSCQGFFRSLATSGNFIISSQASSILHLSISLHHFDRTSFKPVFKVAQGDDKQIGIVKLHYKFGIPFSMCAPLTRKDASLSELELIWTGSNLFSSPRDCLINQNIK